jgi:hypothetical protein
MVVMISSVASWSGFSFADSFYYLIRAIVSCLFSFLFKRDELFGEQR